ncbi:MAG: hypothetical protein ACLUOF_04315 [Ruminococcus sp.]
MTGCEDLAGREDRSFAKAAKPEGFSADIFVSEVYEDVQLGVRRVLLDDMIEQLGNYAHVCPDEKDPGITSWCVPEWALATGCTAGL